MGYFSDNNYDSEFEYARDSYSDSEYGYFLDDEDSEDTLGLALQSLNLGPKKKLLVLSLNGLLIHRAHRHNCSEIPKNRTHDGTYHRNRLVYKRPYLDEFMKFCLDKFEVGLWSSAQEHNNDGVLDCAFNRDVKDKLLFIWDQDECTDTGFKSLEKKQKPVFLKDLSKLWSHLSHSSHGSRFSESNTLMIDDQPYKALCNPANTAIFPEKYDPNNLTDDALEPAKELCKYLEGVAEAEDVPAYVKEHPFGQPAVGSEHPDWDFYSRVLRAVKKSPKS